MQHGGGDAGGNANIAEARSNRAEVVGLLDHVRDGGVVKLNRDGPDVGRTAAFGDGHELARNHAGNGAVGAHREPDTRGGRHLEGQLLAADTEHAVAGSEVQDVHRVGGAVAVHREAERLLPCADRADTQIQRVDDLNAAVHAFHMEIVFRDGSAAGVAERRLREEVSGVERDSIQRDGVGSPGGDALGQVSLAIAKDIPEAAVVGVVDAHQQVAAVVRVRRAEGNLKLALSAHRTGERAVEHDGAVLGAAVGAEGGGSHFLQEHHLVGVVPAGTGRADTRDVELHARDRAAVHRGQLRSGQDELALREVVVEAAVQRNLRTCRRSVVHGQFMHLRMHRTREGQRTHHH